MCFMQRIRDREYNKPEIFSKAMFSKAAFSTTTSPATLKPTAAGLMFLAEVLAATALFSYCSPVQASSNQTIAGQTTPSQSGPSKSAVPSSTAALEFPVVLQQKVIAGKTPAGTKIQAKLTVATLFAGVVIPQDAVLSGEVVESNAKSATDPSRLVIRMDSAQWKNGATPTVIPLTPKLYLTAWYYPAAMTMNRNPPDGIPDAANNPKPWSGGGIYPGQRNPSSPPLSGPDAGKDTFPASTSNISNHRVLMKHIESASDSDGAVILTSTHSNIKLDKSTTYVLAATDLLPVK
jgi:hypothetical protein